jgi:hypothetical protein
MVFQVQKSSQLYSVQDAFKLQTSGYTNHPRMVKLIHPNQKDFLLFSKDMDINILRSVFYEIYDNNYITGVLRFEIQ